MLFILLPLVFVSHFGILGLAILLYPDRYDWRYLSISKLLYPLTNPQFHYIASFGVALTGVLVAPFAGYIRRRLRSRAPQAANLAATLFFGGCICLTAAGLIASHPVHGKSQLPQLHSTLARISVIGIGVGMVLFNVCATRACSLAAPKEAAQRRHLVIAWNLLTIPVILIFITWMLIRIFLKRSSPAYHALASSALWKVGFWEWIGSVVIIAFLVCAVLFLPERESR
jgi:hypothetical protein